MPFRPWYGLPDLGVIGIAVGTFNDNFDTTSPNASATDVVAVINAAIAQANITSAQRRGARIQLPYGAGKCVLPAGTGSVNVFTALKSGVEICGQGESTQLNFYATDPGVDTTVNWFRSAGTLTTTSTGIRLANNGAELDTTITLPSDPTLAPWSLSVGDWVYLHNTSHKLSTNAPGGLEDNHTARVYGLPGSNQVVLSEPLWRPMAGWASAAIAPAGGHGSAGDTAIEVTAGEGADFFRAGAVVLAGSGGTIEYLIVDSSYDPLGATPDVIPFTTALQFTHNLGAPVIAVPVLQKLTPTSGVAFRDFTIDGYQAFANSPGTQAVTGRQHLTQRGILTSGSVRFIISGMRFQNMGSTISDDDVVNGGASKFGQAVTPLFTQIGGFHLIESVTIFNCGSRSAAAMSYNKDTGNRIGDVEILCASGFGFNIVGGGSHEINNVRVVGDGYGTLPGVGAGNAQKGSGRGMKLQTVSFCHCVNITTAHNSDTGLGIVNQARHNTVHGLTMTNNGWGQVQGSGLWMNNSDNSYNIITGVKALASEGPTGASASNWDIDLAANTGDTSYDVGNYIEGTFALTRDLNAPNAVPPNRIVSTV